MTVLDVDSAANLFPEPGDLVFAFGSDKFPNFRHVMLVVSADDDIDDTRPSRYTYAFVPPSGGNITIRTMLRRTMSITGKWGHVRTYDDIFSYPEWSRTKSFVIRGTGARR